ncbi:MAG: phosphoglucosamine mutase [Candidatus Zixiibacteriota bacterium]|nr:MAG: phosphoglucosamine mutase [candidate division Zixibacteria bacterium]
MKSTEKLLVKSTSGIRGLVGRGLEPALATEYAAAFGTLLGGGKVVVGRDTRPSGSMFVRAVTSGLVSVGVDVIDIGIVPTPTVEIAIKQLKARGGICITASHNPAEWNALKFFNNQGEFITPKQYRQLDKMFNSKAAGFKPHNKLGSVISRPGWAAEHVRKTLAVKIIKRAAIRKRKFRVVVDAVNGAGSEALPLLLDKLGAKVIKINCNSDGNFTRGPEPVAKNLSRLIGVVKKHKADLGMACDPDADRLALVDEKGRAIGEELTLAMAVAAVLSAKPGPTVINLSTSKVTHDVAESLGSKVHYSKVGESNVVEMMRARRGVIGGEGNGGVIYPAFHAGRDALIAAALVLSHLAASGRTLSEQVETFPKYYNIKTKGQLKSNFASKLKQFERRAHNLVGKFKVDRRDGLRFDFEQGWLQIRSSNTEPIYRLIVETNSKALTSRLSRQVKQFFT